MSDEDLEILITLDDSWYGPEEDTFHQLQQEDQINEMLFAFI